MSIPECASVDFAVIVTFPFVHAPLLGFVISGAVGASLSIFTICVLVALFPALSIVVTFIVYVLVSFNVVAAVAFDTVAPPVMLYVVDL